MDKDQGCGALMVPGRAEGVHDVLTRLLGVCTCGKAERVVELYTVDGARSAERLSA